MHNNQHYDLNGMKDPGTQRFRDPPPFPDARNISR